jgi:Holliday junction resolvase-like predicted endonuclease
MDIIESNYRANHGEIDIIAIDSHVYVFVEVKTISKKIQSSVVTREVSLYLRKAGYRK